MNTSSSFQWAGHGRRWAALARAFERERVPQTLLISGPPQIGKWTMARRYAQLLLCAAPVRDEHDLPAPCGACPACHQVEIETAPDFYVCRPLVGQAKDEKDWIVAPPQLEGSAILIDVARKFSREATKKPLGARKVMIIVQAERMTDDAQNALLKTFEEPARGLTIILLADNPSKLFSTVRSRCWHLPLSLTGDAAIAAWLQNQFPSAAPEQITLAVAAGAGRPGRAWNELVRLAGQSTPDAASRATQTMQLIERILHSQPLGALGLSEEAVRLAEAWWKDDLALEAETRAAGKSKAKADAKVARSAAARFLDELALAYRSCWAAALGGGQNTSPHEALRAASVASSASSWAAGLDLIRKTRHYILRNASTGLALDVLFGRLIALHRAAVTTGSPHMSGPPPRRW
jgi:DNA polymerase III gamma/tau subunit